jgi:hypothetical protein
MAERRQPQTDLGLDAWQRLIQYVTRDIELRTFVTAHPAPHRAGPVEQD